MPSSPTDSGVSILHATCVEVDGVAVLFEGPSGSGKSDLALRLVAEGARLIADDRTALSAAGGRLRARAPEPIRGFLEVRGLGIVRLEPSECAAEAAVAALIGLTANRIVVKRMPDPAERPVLGFNLPFLELYPFEESATAKLRMFLRTLADPEKLVE
ncbi:HPr kinase/phosphorylase [Minwuia thermotolerans]|uniref:HPr kinase/phosphorylase C-terminal domain-containing protein n=1 Tax=Minwuia thermotolerans TaxID=2056226 RepID=A0A2M9FWE0_9PROT|nr:HPr kinase/phosphatase C-terminal domain-containing protein [Minwuia thermotolerans]PJK27772.1 hypothetical protein CVT23_20010 [Minwuia thermotolerans]